MNKCDNVLYVDEENSLNVRPNISLKLFRNKNTCQESCSLRYFRESCILIENNTLLNILFEGEEIGRAHV
jgi:hypothetical protein